MYRPYASILGGISLTVILAVVPAATVPAQSAELPFLPGEDLRYSVHLGRFGGVGEGSMRIDGVERIGGREVYRLAFDFDGRVSGLARVQDRTRSWLEPGRMTSLRYEKTERTPLGVSSEAVNIDPAAGRWTDQDGGVHRLGAAAPLDELSFLYFIRTLDLTVGTTQVFHRHFDAARNPVEVRVVRRERVQVPAGTFDAVVVEMRVNDPRRFAGAGVLRLHISDDRRRLPVRIETRMPVVGTATLELTTTPRVAVRP